MPELTSTLPDLGSCDELAAMAYSATAECGSRRGMLCALTKGSGSVLLFPRALDTGRGFEFDLEFARVVRLVEEPSQNPQAAGEEAMAIS